MLNQSEIDLLKQQTVPPQFNFISNKKIDGIQGKRLEVDSPIDGKIFTSITDSTAEDVDIAVKAARTSFEQGVWSQSAPAFRKKNNAQMG
ncbi:aldehyde dehydrogenase family protein [Pseudocolwellia sp. HL-MZ19]|uniref:aldehyde dehydrogenase family protein n=1 Tax=Pseudocolwellia sp. HL-MZ19 TaxID=3400846 RepID=UPI003CEFA83E